uniref:Phage tail collar domain-containing protein n=1 Tax=viral metagenome TaxID=1070528 RepID=A0A6C0JRL9_9ZZZZ
MTTIKNSYKFNNIPITSNAATGSIIAYLGISDPTGWVICDGQTRINNSDGKYNNLALMGIGSGGSGTSNYTPPDLRGYFLLGTSNISTIGIFSSDTYAAHSHNTSTTGTGYAHASGTHSHEFYSNNDDYNQSMDNNLGCFWNCTDSWALWNGWGDEFVGKASSYSISDTGHTHSATTGNPDSSGGNETRPYNYNINWIIRYN